MPQERRFARERGSASGERQAYFGPDYGWLAARLLGRPELGTQPQNGPIIVQEFDATVLVPPDYCVMRDGQENLVMRRID